MAESNGHGEPVKLLICVPAYSGKIPVEWLDTALPAVAYLTRKRPDVEVSYHFMTRSFITYAREKAHEYALEKGVDFILWWDDDIIVPEDAIVKLLSHNRDVVTATIFARTKPFPMYAYDKDMLNFSIDRMNTGLQEAEALGTGFMLMNPRVTKCLDKPWYNWPNDNVYAEDVALCLRLRKEGVKLFIDTDLLCGHLDVQYRIISHHHHNQWRNEAIASGIINHPKIKEHEDFRRLEKLINAT